MIPEIIGVNNDPLESSAAKEFCRSVNVMEKERPWVYTKVHINRFTDEIQAMIPIPH